MIRARRPLFGAVGDAGGRGARRHSAVRSSGPAVGVVLVWSLVTVNPSANPSVRFQNMFKARRPGEVMDDGTNKARGKKRKNAKKQTTDEATATCIRRPCARCPSRRLAAQRGIVPSAKQASIPGKI